MKKKKKISVAKISTIIIVGITLILFSWWWIIYMLPMILNAKSFLEVLIPIGTLVIIFSMAIAPFGRSTSPTEEYY